MKFPTAMEKTCSTTRRLNDLYVFKARTYSGMRATAVNGPKLWNNLPSSIKTSESLQSFTSRPRTFYIS